MADPQAEDDPIPAIPGWKGLVTAARSGDPEAMNILLGGLRPYILALCRAQAGQDAADVAQEALLAVYRGLPGLREPDVLLFWVRRITLRELSHHLRKRWPSPTDVIAETPGPQSTETRFEIIDILRRLSPEHCCQLLLRDVFGFEESSAAAVTGLTVGTVKSRLHRARSSFRRAWTDSSC